LWSDRGPFGPFVVLEFKLGGIAIFSYIFMLKVARKPSTDPVQEKLRNNKALWNKEISVFINDLIHLKKTMNGWPSKFYQEKSFIKEPIPADPVSILGVLTGDFQEIAQKGNGIVQEQLNYAKTRRKKQPKQLNLPLGQPQPKPTTEPAAPEPDLSQQLALPSVASQESDLVKVASKFEDKYSFEKEASNVFTRFFTKLFNPTIGFGDKADLRRARMAMLDSAATSYKGLAYFQATVVKSSKDSIHVAQKQLDEVWNNWNLVSKPYAIFKASKSINAPDKGGTIESLINKDNDTEEKILEKTHEGLEDISPEEAAEEVSEQSNRPRSPQVDPIYRLEVVKNMAADYRNYYPLLASYNLDGGGYLYELDAAVDKLVATKGKVITPDFNMFYEKAVRYSNQELGTTANSFREMVSQLKARAKQQLKPQPAIKPVPVTPAVVEDAPPDTLDPTKTAMEKTAQKFLQKWFGKTRHQLSMFDKTSSNRLNCFKMAEELRKEINNIMNELEKGLDQEKLDPLMKNAQSKMTILRGLMRSLHLSLQLAEKSKKPQKPKKK